MLGDMSGSAFPPAYRTIPLCRLLDAFERGPSRLRRTIAGLSEDEIRAHPRPGHWSIKENIVHVVDSEIVGAVRFRMVLAEPGATLPCYDPRVWADILGYQAFDAEDLAAVLTEFEALRRTSAVLFRNLEAADWRREGIHPELGPVTLRQLLELYADHSEWHIWLILDLRRRLGRPVDLPLLLPDRLFATGG